MNRISNNHLSFVFALSAVVLVVGCGSQSAVPLQLGDQAPPFELTDVSTHKSVLSESLQGDVVLLNFWSTTCAVCMKEIEELKEIQAGGRAKVVGIAIDGDPEKVHQVAQSKGINYSVLCGNEDVFLRYDGYSIPYTLVLDRNSIVRKKYFGLIEKGEFDELLGEL